MFLSQFCFREPLSLPLDPIMMRQSWYCLINNSWSTNSQSWYFVWDLGLSCNLQSTWLIFRAEMAETLRTSSISPFWGPELEPPLAQGSHISFHHVQLKHTDQERNVTWLLPDSPASKWQSEDLNPELSNVKVPCCLSSNIPKESSSCDFQVLTFTFSCLLHLPCKILTHLPPCLSTHRCLIMHLCTIGTLGTQRLIQWLL